MSAGHAPLVLSSWREGVLPVRILVPDSPVRSMNDQFGTLIASNLAGDVYRILLRSGACSSAGIACAFNLPPAIRMRGYMLIFTHVGHLTSNVSHAHNEDT